MEFSYQFSASAEAVFEKMIDADFVAKRCLQLGSLEAACTSDGEDMPEIVIQRTEEAELPTIMKKIVGKQQHMKTVETWSETEESYDSASLTTIKGTPIKIEATQCLYNLESGSEISVSLDVSAKIPLLSSKVEPMVASKVRQEMLREYEYLDAQLN